MVKYKNQINNFMKYFEMYKIEEEVLFCEIKNELYFTGYVICNDECTCILQLLLLTQIHFFFLHVDKYDLFFSGYLFKKQKSYLCVNFSQVYISV